MPDYFSHASLAEVVFDRLPARKRELIANKTLYLLGAQGGDVFFAYNLTPTKSNLGRELHRLDPSTLFEKLADGNLSYAAGFATHYALDCTLHEAVYKYAYSRRFPLSHMQFENDLGLFITRYFSLRRKILPLEKLLSCTFPVYDSLSRLKSEVTVQGVERCLKRHFKYSLYLYKTKRSSYKCDYDFSSLAGKTEEATLLSATCISAILEKNFNSEIFSKPFLNGKK